jgi:hypothetical protein
MATKQRQIYQVRITLLHSRPPIWRRLLVPAELTLGQLHKTLQAALGWTNSHLHEFRVGGRTYGRPDWEDSFVGEPMPEDERKVRLDGILAKVGMKVIYTYDFGDGWEHEVVLEKVLAFETGHAYPFCLDGERHCPPEDCGGVPGYEDVLRVMRDRYHPEHTDTLRWLGGKFDPEEFSVDKVNQGLERLRPRKKTARVSPHKAPPDKESRKS